jgi:hypothetical protein
VPRVITWLCHLLSRGCATCQSGFRISRNRGFRFHCSLHCKIPNPETPMAYRPRFFCRSDGYRVSASNLTAKTCPPIELLPMALDRCHASFQVDGPDYVGISPWLFPMINLVQLLSDLTVLVLSGNLDGIQRSLTLLPFSSLSSCCAHWNISLAASI